MVAAFTQAQSFEWNTKSPSPAQVTPANANQAAYEKAYNERQVGMAGTYYGTAEGRQTAYGETFRNSEMTASHRLLPLGTLLQVINLDNGKRATVRVNDRGQSCADCLIQLSSTAASSIGIQGYGQVSVERVGFSNWNPVPPRQTTPAPTAYTSVSSYSNPSYNTPAPAGGVVRPVSIGGETVGWNAKGGEAPQAAPSSYGTVATYQQPGLVRPETAPTTVTPQANTAVLSAPSVLSREVNPATRANQPATFSRRPTVVPQTTVQAAPATASPQSYYQPTTTYPQPQPYYNQPSYTVPQPVQQTPGQVVPQQAAPPQPTVQRFQARGGTVTPESYGQPVVNTPTAYAAVPAATVPSPAPAPIATGAPGARTGFAVQLGAYNNELYAKNRVTQLQASGLANVFYLSSTKPDGQVINRVYAGTFPTMADAQVAATDIRNDYQIAGIVTKM